MEHCFRKRTKPGEQLSMSYIISSDKKEYLKVLLKDLSQKDNSILYSNKDGDQSGKFKVKNKEPKVYSLCFYPSSISNYQVTFEFNSESEIGGLTTLATDNQIKNLQENLVAIKEVFGEIENNLKFQMDRKISHTNILLDIIQSVKNLTILKVAVIGIFSVFQICVIQKFFGPTKIVKSVKGAFSDNL